MTGLFFDVCHNRAQLQYVGGAEGRQDKLGLFPEISNTNLARGVVTLVLNNGMKLETTGQTAACAPVYFKERAVLVHRALAWEAGLGYRRFLVSKSPSMSSKIRHL